MTSESAATAVHAYPPGASETPPVDAPAEKRLTSRYRGVCWNRKNKRWQAAINRAGRYIYLGSFRSEYDAARAFDRAAVRLKGQQAKLNFNFSDYQADMSWHHQLAQMGDPTEIVLGNPKLLREGLQAGPVNQGVVPMMGHYEAPAFPLRPMRRSPQGFSQVPWTEHPLPGRVIGQAQVPQQVVVATQCGNMATSVYPYLVPKQQQQSTPYEKQPLQPGLLPVDGNGMLPPVCGQYTGTASFSFPLRDPSIKAEPHTTQPMTPDDRLLPVVNLPEGAELIHVFRGAGDAFASVFVRKDSTVAEVLLYDGRAMHEVGSFSSRGDAAQTCQSLLKILTSVKSEDEPQQFGAQGPCTPCSVQQSRPRESQAIHAVLDEDTDVPVRDKPPGKSPFEVEPGKRPSFGSDKAEEIREYANEEMMFEENNQQSPLTVDASGISGQDSLAKRMGSLLEISKGSLEQQAALGHDSFTKQMGSLLGTSNGSQDGRSGVIPSMKPIKDCKSGVGTHVYSSLSLINSGSLKNLLAVFNQSGNFSILKKEEDEEDQANQQMHLLQSQVSFAFYDEPLGIATPRLGSPERAPFHPHRPVASRADDSVDYICDMPDDKHDGAAVFSKRKFAGEMAEEQIKKRREGPRDGALY